MKEMFVYVLRLQKDIPPFLVLPTAKSEVYKTT